MPTIGLTGNLASGKSAVLKLFKSKGAIAFDADKKIHCYYRDKKSIVYKKISAAFPQSLRAGVISRKKLSDIVFSNKIQLKKLERIVHPVIIKELLGWLKGKSKSKVYIAEVPLLFEKNLARYFQVVILVTAKRQILVQRIMKKYGFSKKEALSRLSLYKPIGEKIKGSDFVVDNNLDFKRLKKEVDLLWKKIK